MQKMLVFTKKQIDMLCDANVGGSDVEELRGAYSAGMRFIAALLLHVEETSAVRVTVEHVYDEVTVRLSVEFAVLFAPEESESKSSDGDTSAMSSYVYKLYVRSDEAERILPELYS